MFDVGKYLDVGIFLDLVKITRWEVPIRLPLVEG